MRRNTIHKTCHSDCWRKKLCQLARLLFVMSCCVQLLIPAYMVCVINLALQISMLKKVHVNWQSYFCENDQIQNHVWQPANIDIGGAGGWTLHFYCGGVPWKLAKLFPSTVWMTCSMYRVSSHCWLSNSSPEAREAQRGLDGAWTRKPFSKRLERWGFSLPSALIRVPCGKMRLRLKM